MLGDTFFAENTVLVMSISQLSYLPHYCEIAAVNYANIVPSSGFFGNSAQHSPDFQQLYDACMELYLNEANENKVLKSANQALRLENQTLKSKNEKLDATNRDKDLKLQSSQKSRTRRKPEEEKFQDIESENQKLKSENEVFQKENKTLKSVSYTHLTLPTICSV